MAHRVHPKAFRLGETADWGSRWFDNKNFRQYLEQDYRIRDFLEKSLKDFGIQGIEIERFSEKINVIINTARPGLIIGRGGKGVEDLKKKLQAKILTKKDKTELKIEIKEIRDPWSKALFAGQWVSQQIERRLPFRRVLKQSIEKIKLSKKVQGARVELSGRLNGVSIARREWLSFGRLPRQTIRADIDYAQINAFCTYGVIGIKVWIYKGEKFKKQEDKLL